MWAAIFHISDVQILHNEPFNEIRDTVGSTFDRVSEKIHFVTNDASAEKMCQIVIIGHSSAQFEKLNICIVCYITNYKNSLNF